MRHQIDHAHDHAPLRGRTAFLAFFATVFFFFFFAFFPTFVFAFFFPVGRVARPPPAFLALLARALTTSGRAPAQ
ncbi:MAG TPA: hypothetical protein VKB89_13040, partial [Xanthobacteraceae bacterium]|nr:hypothetical protein [Xanthobacteraceae bacterium]